MKNTYFIPVKQDRSNFFSPKNLSDFIELSNGRYRNNIPFQAQYIQNDKGENSDWTWVDNYTVIVVRRIVADNPYFKNFEFINIENNIDYKIVNPKMIDCLDFNKSQIQYFKASHRIKAIEKYCFIQSKIPNDTLMFKIEKLDCSPVFVTEKFIDIYNKMSYTGFNFKNVQTI